MSGLICLFDRGQGSAGSDEVATMLETISHRGPDGSGAWHNNHAGLGHQQLQSTPESVFDDQPRRDEELVIVSDARLDNRTELLKTLPITTAPSQIPDSSILLAAYRKWGRDCVDRLVGAFAFVIWNTDTRTVFCARDHFGVKPLYYHLDDQLFAAASEPKAILSLPAVPTNVDDLMIADFLMHKFENQMRSHFESVRRLPPATAMTVDVDEKCTWQYWDLDPTRTVTLGSDAAYERRFRELFEQAVRDRLRSNGPVGTDLSGGLDSSAITVTARDLLPETEPLHAFSDVYEDAPTSDEREFIETVVERDGIRSIYNFVDDTGLLVDIDDVLNYFDHPPHNTTHFAKWERLKLVSDAGVTVHLNGEQGDSTVSHGLGYLPQLLKTGRWLRLNHELEELGEVIGAPKHQLLLRNALRPLVPVSVERLVRNLRGEPVLAERANPTLNPDFVRKHDLDKRFKSYDYDTWVFSETARRQQRRSCVSGRQTATFETIDLIHAAFGVEPRYPFTDIRLVEYTLAIPPSQQLADGYTRSIVRRSLDDLLPEKIQWRPWKTLPAEAFHNALSNEQDRVQRLIQNPEPITEYIDGQALRESYERFLADESGVDPRSLWKAISLAAWLEKYG